MADPGTVAENISLFQTNLNNSAQRVGGGGKMAEMTKGTDLLELSFGYVKRVIMRKM